MVPKWKLCPIFERRVCHFSHLCCLFFATIRLPCYLGSDIPWSQDSQHPNRLTPPNTLTLLLFLSIFIAFILEAFFVAYSLEKSEVETAIEKKIQELRMGIQE